MLSTKMALVAAMVVALSLSVGEAAAMDDLSPAELGGDDLGGPLAPLQWCLAVYGWWPLGHACWRGLFVPPWSKANVLTCASHPFNLQERVG